MKKLARFIGAVFAFWIIGIVLTDSWYGGTDIELIMLTIAIVANVYGYLPAKRGATHDH